MQLARVYQTLDDSVFQITNPGFQFTDFTWGSMVTPKTQKHLNYIQMKDLEKGQRQWFSPWLLADPFVERPLQTPARTTLKPLMQ